jgi:crotonobetainyl-CoA:carnitine CoA-transferase CaiB-like acyl-CoA transferase
MNEQILDGIRVLDFSQILAGPSMTRLMVEMGADVLKIEQPTVGDLSRVTPFIRDGWSGFHIQQNRGKRSLCVDLATDEGKDIVRGLLPDVDVVVENFRPGVLARLGFGFDSVAEVNPRAIMCSISALGSSGPLSGKPGFDNVAQGYSGISSMSSEPGRAPVQWATGVGDVLAGVNGLVGILGALLLRERTGRGQHVEVAILDTYFASHEMSVQRIDGSGGVDLPRGVGAQHPLVPIFGNFQVKDRYMFIAAQFDHFWHRLCTAMGRPDLESGELSKQNGRVPHADRMYREVQDWLDGFDDVFAAVAALDEAGVPCAPHLYVEEALVHPHLVERGTVRTVHDRVWGDLRIPGFPIRFSEGQVERPYQAPYLGEHNAEVLEGELGYDAGRVADLHRRGVLWSAVPQPDGDPADPRNEEELP